MKLRERLATPYTWIALLGALFAAGFAYVFAHFLVVFMMVPVPVASHLAWALEKGPSITVTAVFVAVFVFVVVFLQLVRADDEAQERDVAAHSSALASAPSLSSTAPDAPIAEPEPETYATPSRVDRFAVVLALVAYGFSVLFLPPFECDSDQPFFKLAPIGGMPLLLFGWLGITVMDLRWFANPVLLLMMVQLWKGSTRLMVNMWPILASLAAVTTVLFPARVCSYQPSKSLAIGGYVWVLVLLAISALYAARLRKAKAEARGNSGSDPELGGPSPN